MIEILSAALPITVQDLGRFGHASIGVPNSGWMDSYSANLANHLINNSPTDAVLEVTFGGCSLKFNEVCEICITGADFTPKVDNKQVKQNTPLNITKGAVLSFGNRRYGLRTYIAIRGGFQTKSVLGSRSFYPEITSKTILKKGDWIPYNALNPSKKGNFASVRVKREHFESVDLECTKGPEFDLLSPAQKKQLLENPLKISSENNRMGYRLVDLIPNKFPSMLTSGVLPGTVQLTPVGKLIILMKDCQVTGGYPRILQLTDNAINKLGQKTTGDSIQFHFYK